MLKIANFLQTIDYFLICFLFIMILIAFTLLRVCACDVCGSTFLLMLFFQRRVMPVFWGQSFF